jgi:hypothetical protein
VTNGATGSLTDVLSSSAGTDGVFTAENTVSGLEAGQSGVITVSVESDLPGVYVANNESVCGFISQDPDLPNEQVNPGIVLSAEIYNYAQPVITNLSAYDGGTSFATLTQYGYNWNLNFGTIAKNSAQFYGGLLEIQNAVSDLTLSDGLAGIIVTHGSGFITSIPNSFNYEAILSLQPVDTKVGAHTLTIVIEPLSVDSSSTTALEYVTLTITDDVISSSGTGSSQGTISIISSGVTGGVVLGESRYSDNLTITSTGSVQYASLSGSGILGRDAVLAPAIAGTVSVVNAGSVVGQSAEAGGYGVALLGEGSLFNSGHISGGSGQEGGTGVGLTGNLGQLFVNSGQVYGGAGYEAGGNGVFAGNSAVVSNSGTILGGNATGTNAPGGYGGTGLVLTSGALTNTGLIAGGIGQSGGTGVEVLVGTLINNGTISAGVSEGGIADSQTTIAAIYLAQIGLVQNNGLADGVFGIELSGGGIIINSGKITGTTDGVALHANGTVTNTGIISGGVNAVAFAQGSDSRLIISANSDIIGAISGGGGVLELSADGHTAGKFSAAMNSQFADFATMQIDPGAIWDFTGRFTFGAATALVNDGTITEASTASLTIDAALTGTGVFDLSKKPLTLNGGVSSDEKISFTGTSETLVLGDPRGVKGKIEKFAAGDTIDLTSIKISAITATHFAGGVLTLTEASGKLQLTFASPASFGSKHFVLFKDGSGTGVTLSSATAALPSPTNAYTATTFSSASPTNGAVLGLLNIFATASSLPSLLKL